jgi:hypothetical protein
MRKADTDHGPLAGDWRRRALELPTTGPISEAAVRAAYWRLVGRCDDRERLKAAKRELLHELGVRTPARRPKAIPHAADA